MSDNRGEVDYLISLAERYEISTFDQKDLDLLDPAQISSDVSNDVISESKDEIDEPTNDLTVSMLQDRILMMTEEHRKSIKQYRERVQQLISAKDEAETLLDESKKEFEKELQQQQQKTYDDIWQVQRRLQKLEAEGSILQNLRVLKENFTNLLLTPSQYMEIENVPEHQQTLREYICKKVYELVQETKSNRGEILERCDSLTIENEQLKKELSNCKNIYSSDRKQWNEYEISLKKQIEQLSANVNILTEKYNKLHSEYIETEVERNQIKQLMKRIGDLEIENENLRTQNSLHATSLKNISTDKVSIDSKLELLHRQIELLESDKKYLINETSSLKDERNRMIIDKERLVMQLDDVRVQRDQAIESLSNLKVEQKKSLESQFNEELNHMKIRTQQEIDDIKFNQKDGYEREIRLLKESRDLCVEHRDRLEEQLKVSELNLRQCREELHKVQLHNNDTNVHLRTELRMKTFESQRLQIAYDEQSKEMTKLKNDYEKQQTKINVLRSEYDRMELQTEKKVNKLNVDIDTLKQKLSSYELLELQLDKAISSVPADNDNSCSELLANVGSTVVTSNARRMEQSVKLAQQLLEKNQQVKKLEHQLTLLNTEHKIVKKELDDTKSKLNTVQQPYNFLIHSIKDREDALNKQENLCNELQQRLKTEESRYKELLLKYEQLKSDLKRLLTQEEYVQTVKRMILKLDPIQRPKHSVIKAEKQSNNISDNVSPSNTKNNKQTGKAISENENSSSNALDKLLVVKRESDELDVQNPLLSLLTQKASSKSLNSSKHWLDRLSRIKQ